jgi:hypothetical protein
LHRCRLLSLLWLLGCSHKAAPRPTPVEHDEPHEQARPRVVAPSVVSLSQAARARVTALYISSARDGVTLKKTAVGWETAYAPYCQVAPGRVEAALDALMPLTAVETQARIASGQDFTLKVVAYAEQNKLLKLALGPQTPDGQLVQLDDGTTLALRGFQAQLLPAEPQFWCDAR